VRVDAPNDRAWKSRLLEYLLSAGRGFASLQTGAVSPLALVPLWRGESRHRGVLRLRPFTPSSSGIMPCGVGGGSRAWLISFEHTFVHVPDRDLRGRAALLSTTVIAATCMKVSSHSYPSAGYCTFYDFPSCPFPSENPGRFPAPVLGNPIPPCHQSAGRKNAAAGWTADQSKYGVEEAGRPLRQSTNNPLRCTGPPARKTAIEDHSLFRRLGWSSSPFLEARGKKGSSLEEVPQDPPT